MDFNRITLLFHTLKFLKGKQIYYRLFYFVRNRFFPPNRYKPLDKATKGLVWQGEEIYFNNSLFEEKAFTFLNIPHEFGQELDWNYNKYGKLWTYNLNYFDFLNQKTIEKEKAIGLIWDYIKAGNGLKDGIEPYTISLRGINWIKFLSRNRIKEHEIDKILYRHYQILCSNLEYHLLGNHLLENGFSLFFGAYYFQCDHLYKKGKEILMEELKEQILDDGAHFELSPMYHQILLHRLLDCIKLAQLNPWKEDGLLTFLKEKAERMLSWLESMTYDNGDIPMVNDAAFNIAPSTKEIKEFAMSLHLEWGKAILGASGYRKFNKCGFEVVMDVGNVGPDYQPGHAHSDTLGFEIYLNGLPFIVDTGTSTYEKNELRQKERETSAHNTVTVGKKDQTKVWGGFRVAQRAKIIHLEEGEFWVKASHNGYAPTIHQREFKLADATVEIIDALENQKENAKAHYHFHPNVHNVLLKGNHIQFPDQGLEMRIDGAIGIEKVQCEIATGFNMRQKAWALTASFENSLKTTIQKMPK